MWFSTPATKTFDPETVDGGWRAYADPEIVELLDAEPPCDPRSDMVTYKRFWFAQRIDGLDALRAFPRRTRRAVRRTLPTLGACSSLFDALAGGVDALGELIQQSRGLSGLGEMMDEVGVHATAEAAMVWLDARALRDALLSAQAHNAALALDDNGDVILVGRSVPDCSCDEVTGRAPPPSAAFAITALPIAPAAPPRLLAIS
jgi:hypothetical protein